MQSDGWHYHLKWLKFFTGNAGDPMIPFVRLLLLQHCKQKAPMVSNSWVESLALSVSYPAVKSGYIPCHGMPETTCIFVLWCCFCKVTLHRNISKFRSPQHHFESFTSTTKNSTNCLQVPKQKIDRGTCHPPKTMTPWTPQVPHQSSTETFAGRFPPGWTQSLRVQLESTPSPKIASEGCEGLDIGILSSQHPRWGGGPSHIYLSPTSSSFSYQSSTKSTKSDGRTHLAPPQHHIGPRTRQGLVKDIFFRKDWECRQIQINMWPKIDVN